MCIGTAGAALAMGKGFQTALAVGGAALDYATKVQQVSNWNTYASNNSVAATQSAIDQWSQLNTQQSESRYNTAHKKQDAYLKGRQAAGTALASSQNEGTSTNLSLGDLARQVLREQSRATTEGNLKEQSFNEQRKGIYQQQVSRINSMPHSDTPSAFGLLISGLGSAAREKSAYTNHAPTVPLKKVGNG